MLLELSLMDNPILLFVLSRDTFSIEEHLMWQEKSYLFYI